MRKKRFNAEDAKVTRRTRRCFSQPSERLSILVAGLSRPPTSLLPPLQRVGARNGRGEFGTTARRPSRRPLRGLLRMRMMLMPSTISPHPEEHFGESRSASRRTLVAPAARLSVTSGGRRRVGRSPNECPKSPWPGLSRSPMSLRQPLQGVGARNKSGHGGFGIAILRPSRRPLRGLLRMRNDVDAIDNLSSS